MIDLKAFVAESNRIEGMLYEPTEAEIEATETFLNLPAPNQNGLVELVSELQPDAVLRDRGGLNVRIGDRIAPPGGVDVVVDLGVILDQAADNLLPPFDVHTRYENLHPFTDGNGRSGRALWAWQMLKFNYPAVQLGFLHAFYYQALQASHF